jgi:hypothetical protein
MATSIFPRTEHIVIANGDGGAQGKGLLRCRFLLPKAKSGLAEVSLSG